MRKIFDGITIGVAVLMIISVCAIDSVSRVPTIVLVCSIGYMIVFMVTNWERIQRLGGDER